ncbi:hypothetical protein [Nonomuraea candida]|uniref:hypothetical protein n=1 Tax=Nonomuraea candida TaxID=359159 RepID=UPI0005BA570D|nr:hypothetical protein [Nonomuraea candida]
MAELVEDFNDGSYVVTFGGTWARSTTTPQSGAGCFKSATIANEGASDCTVTVPAGASAVRFWYRVSSESGYDYFQFFIAGTEKTEVKASGSVGWTQSPEFAVTPGQTLTFRYSKDVTASAGEDAAYIDNLTFTVDDAPPRPVSNWAAAVTRASRF